MSNWTAFEPECGYPIEVSTVRFALLSTASSLAAVGALWNWILIAIFIKGRLFEPVLALLALCDSFLCLCYIALFGVEAAAYYLRVRLFYLAWYSYIHLMFPFSLAVLTSIPSVLILSMAQRCAVLMHKSRVLRDSVNCSSIGLLLVLVACASRIPTFLSMELHDYNNCTEFFQSKQIYTSIGGFYPSYELALTFVQVFLPFPILLTLNLTVVHKLRGKRRAAQQRLFDSRTRDRRNAAPDVYGMVSELTNKKKNEQNALISMVIVVCTYLLCNSLNLACTAFEKWATHLVRDGSGWTDFSLVSKDVVSFLYTLSSVIRLPIYYRFNGLVRREVASLFCNSYFFDNQNSKRTLRRNLRANFSARSIRFRSENDSEDENSGDILL